jgi:uncharacterized protein
VERRSLTVSRPNLADDSLGFFRWGRVADKILVTTDAGEWVFLNDAEFQDLLTGRVTDGHPLFPELQRKGLLRDGLDLEALSLRMAQRNRHLRRGPYLHVVTLTLGGTQNGAGAAADGDMSAETAEQVVDFALQSTSQALTFELQGGTGEPLKNFDVLRHLVEFARSRNRNAAGKTLSFRLLSNFTGMTEEAAEWLIANDVLVTTTLDGPAQVHDWNRKWLGGGSHADVVRWIEYFTRRYGALGRDPSQWRVDALMVTTRRSLDAAREIVDEYVLRGLRCIHLQALERWRFDGDAWAQIGYGVEEYLEFYRRTLDHVLESSRRGVDIMERMASIFLSRILTADDAGIVDLQSPSGAGTGQLVYGVDGQVFPCDEARVVDAGGEAIFALGQVRDLTIPEVVRHPTVRAIATASLLDAQPMCADCWNKPFCGFSPVRNFAEQGDLFGQRPHCSESKEHMGVSRRLFELLSRQDDPETAEILKRWTANLPRFAVDGRAHQAAP